LHEKIVFSADDQSQAGRRHETQRLLAGTSLWKTSKPAESLSTSSPARDDFSLTIKNIPPSPRLPSRPLNIDTFEILLRSMACDPYSKKDAIDLSETEEPSTFPLQWFVKMRLITFCRPLPFVTKLSPEKMPKAA
jgi:hypothetical protein